MSAESHKKRNQGRQPKKWMDTVKEDTEATMLNVVYNKQWFWCETETNGNIK